MRRGTATYEDFLKVPPEKVAEILDGELIVSPRPAPRHASAAFGLGVDLAVFDQQRRRDPDDPGGWCILPEPELHFARGGVPDILVRDLAGWRLERMPSLPSTAFFELNPDWVCEILPLSTAVIDHTRKRRIYAAARVRHLWFLDPIAQILDVYRLEGERYVLLASHAEKERVRAEPFETVEFDLTRWWPPAP